MVYSIINYNCDRINSSTVYNHRISFEYSKIINTVVEPPAQFSLNQNYPNQFNPSTKISFQIPERGQTKLKVFDALGNEVATVVDGIVDGGKRWGQDPSSSLLHASC